MTARTRTRTVAPAPEEGQASWIYNEKKKNHELDMEELAARLPGLEHPGRDQRPPTGPRLWLDPDQLPWPCPNGGQPMYALLMWQPEQPDLSMVWALFNWTGRTPLHGTPHAWREAGEAQWEEPLELRWKESSNPEATTGYRVEIYAQCDGPVSTENADDIFDLPFAVSGPDGGPTAKDTLHAWGLVPVAESTHLHHGRATIHAWTVFGGAQPQSPLFATATARHPVRGTTRSPLMTATPGDPSQPYVPYASGHVGAPGRKLRGVSHAAEAPRPYYMLPGTDLSPQSQRYCRCLAHLSVHALTEDIIQTDFISRLEALPAKAPYKRPSGAYPNPYAICHKSTREPTNPVCYPNMAFENLPDAELLGIAYIKGLLPAGYLVEFARWFTQDNEHARRAFDKFRMVNDDTRHRLIGELYAASDEERTRRGVSTGSRPVVA